MSDRPASWRMPTEKQIEKLASQPAREPDPVTPAFGPADDLPEGYWESIARDSRGLIRTGIPIQQRRLSEISTRILRVTCRRCDRIVEIKAAHATRLYGSHAVWKDVGTKLFDAACQERTGSHEDDGCWPSFAARE